MKLYTPYTGSENLVIPVLPEKPITEIPQLKKCLVAVYQRPNLRVDEFQVYMGKPYLDQLFNPEIPLVDNSIKNIYLHYPERWLNIVEQRSLFARIGKYFPKIEELIIVTHSVYIVQCIRGDYIRIFTPVDYNKDLLPQESVEGKLYVE
jgi:hypothetical protein